MEEMLITRPQRLVIMDGSAYLVHRNVPVSMAPTSRFHLSTGNSCTGEMNCRPALFTRMSRPPNSRAVAATMASTSSGRLTSARTGIAWPPAASISWATVRAPTSCRSHTPTAAPCDASIPAIARPSPYAHAPAHQPRDGNRHRGVTRGDPHDDDPPAVADRPEGVQNRLRPPQRLKRDIHAATAGDFHGGGCYFLLGRIDHVRRAYFPGGLQFVRTHVDGDDLRGPTRPGDLNDVGTHASRRHHHHRLACPQIGLMPDRAVGGEHGTAENAGLCQGNVSREGKYVGGGHHRVLCQAAHAVHRQGSAVGSGEPGRAVIELTPQPVELEEGHAQIISPLRAIRAGTAGHDKGANHGRANRRAGDAGAKCGHSP